MLVKVNYSQQEVAPFNKAFNGMEVENEGLGWSMRAQLTPQMFYSIA